MAGAVKRRRLLIVAALLLAAIGVRALLPFWVLDALNARLAALGDYHGAAVDVDLALYRGAYSVHELRIEKRGGAPTVPLLVAPRIDLSLSWRELFGGALVGEIDFHSPELNFVDGRRPEEDMAGRGVDWRDRLEALFPLRINEVRIHDGTIAFRNPWSNPPVDLRMTQVDAQVGNLTNIRDAAGARAATLEARARILDSARLQVAASFDPWDELGNFSLDLKIRDIQLQRINPLARAYAGLDFASGQGDFVMELQARDRRLRGYAKPLLDDIDILDWEQDLRQDQDHPLRLAWEGVTGAVSRLFRNQPRDRFATRIEIDGRTDAPGIDALGAIVGVLRNAFVRAYEANFEGVSPDKDNGAAP